MEALQQARLFYKQRYQQQGLAFLNDRHTHQLEAKIQRLIEIAIKEVPSVILFQTPDYLNIFERALKHHSKATEELATLAKTYECLEKYFLQLVEQPWKREFKKIKLYGGFYRTRIKSALPEPELIFIQAGYSLQPDKQILKLESDVQTENVLMLAFDSRLCREQCQIITEHYEIVKGLSASLEQAINEILYSDRSRGRSGVFVSSPYESNGLQVNLQPLNGERDKNSTATSNLGVPNIPKREPIERLDNTRYLSPEEVMGPVIDLQNRKLERTHDYFEGAHLLQPYSPQISGTSKNGHVGPEEWNQFYQAQMLSKTDQNYEIPPTKSALHNAAMSTPSENYPRSTVTGLQKMSINESYDEGIEKDFPPLSKSSREVSAPYPSIPLKSGLNQGGTVVTKLPNSSFQPSLADQGYNTAFTSNAHNMIPNPAGAPRMIPLQSQQSLGNGIYADGVNSPPVGPPPIPPRALKPDFGMKNNALLPNDVASYPSSHTFSQQTAKSDFLSHSDIAKRNPSTESLNPKFQKSSVISTASMLPPMPTPKLSHSGPVLRRDRHPLGNVKSSSLKYNVGAVNIGTPSSLLPGNHNSRAARSMDISNVYERVPGSHLQPLDLDPVPGVSKKPCPACTLENDPDRTHCSLCEAKLENPFTYV